MGAVFLLGVGGAYSASSAPLSSWTSPTGSGRRAAARDSGGGFAAASDREILDWFGHVVRDEGVFCEPSSAASLAGLANARRDGLVPEGAEVVCVLTGNGLKDPDNAIAESAPPVTIPAERDALERIVLGLRRRDGVARSAFRRDAGVDFDDLAGAAVRGWAARASAR